MVFKYSLFSLKVFDNVPETVQNPSWLNDTDFVLDHTETSSDKPGRTYVATKTLPNGQGAFAYVGVSLTGKKIVFIETKYFFRVMFIEPPLNMLI